MRGKINIHALHSFPFVAYFATTFYKFNPCLLTSDLFISLSTFLPGFSKLRNKMPIKNCKWTLEERGCVNTLVIVGDSYLLWILAVRKVSKSKDTVIIKLLWASKGEILIYYWLILRLCVRKNITNENAKEVRVSLLKQASWVLVHILVVVFWPWTRNQFTCSSISSTIIWGSCIWWLLMSHRH